MTDAERKFVEDVRNGDVPGETEDETIAALLAIIDLRVPQRRLVSPEGGFVPDGQRATTESVYGAPHASGGSVAYPNTPYEPLTLEAALKLANPRPWRIEKVRDGDKQQLMYAIRDAVDVLVTHFHPLQDMFTMENWEANASLIIQLVNAAVTPL